MIVTATLDLGDEQINACVRFDARLYQPEFDWLFPEVTRRIGALMRKEVRDMVKRQNTTEETHSG